MNLSMNLNININLTGVMRVTAKVMTVMAAAGLMLATASRARAAEPRPWLCRDKPVFSSDKPMTYAATRRGGGGEWMMTFMRFDPDGGHDGFTVYATQTVAGQASGTLEPGQWYAVGLYRQGSHWICSPPAAENHRFVPGVVRDLCYGEEQGGCEVKLTVRDGAPGAAPHL